MKKKDLTKYWQAMKLQGATGETEFTQDLLTPALAVQSLYSFPFIVIES